MNSSRLLCVALLLSTVGSRQVLAWTGSGHMVIAAEAFQHLSAADRAKTTGILKGHPEFDKWQQSFQADTPGLDLDAFIFMQASTWPDEIRHKRNKYDHPHWHYVDYPLKPPLFPLEPGPTPNDDALYGIAQCEKTLSDPGTPAEMRAVYLSYLIHLIGDLHQPLHCASLVNDAYPHGDEGGNAFYVRPGAKGIKLHALWDGLLGTSNKPHIQWNYAITLEAQFPKRRLKELTKAKTPKGWSLQSRGIAIEKAYLRGALRASASPGETSALPEGYAAEAKAVAERQAALAGYRLASEIHKCVR